ncbi:MAG: hypothetical protein LC747_00600 [Acidobacteria bacterium]|nr:hypothetical protein [Acidobacteriota bacterium]
MSPDVDLEAKRFGSKLAFAGNQIARYPQFSMMNALTSNSQAAVFATLSSHSILKFRLGYPFNTVSVKTVEITGHMPD